MYVISVDELRVKRRESKKERMKHQSELNDNGLAYAKEMHSCRMHSYTDRRERARFTEED